MSSFRPSKLRQTGLSEYAVRFIFGGLVTAITGVIAKVWGPSIGGLFMAFPAILPASLTLLKRHDGRNTAIDAARGSRVGAIGLIAFGAAVSALAGYGATLSLILASVAWAMLSLLLWRAVHGSVRGKVRRVHSR